MSANTFSLASNGFVGSIHYPQISADTAVITFTGSDGGLMHAQFLANCFAERGIAALALAYFGHPELSDTLKLVPLEYIEHAALWLKENTPATRIALYGISKGAEYALSAAARFPFVESVVAVVPNYYVAEGLGKRPTTAGDSSWSYQGEPLPYLPLVNNRRALLAASIRERQLSMKTLYTLSEQAGVPEDAIIPVEKSKARLLLLSSTQDSMWPSKHAAKRIVARLNENAYRLPYAHKNIPVASHLLSPLPFISAKIKLAMRVERRHPEECAQARAKAFELAVSWIQGDGAGCGV